MEFLNHLLPVRVLPGVLNVLPESLPMSAPAHTPIDYRNRAEEPLARLRSRLHTLADMLAVWPPPDRDTILFQVQQIGTIYRETGKEFPVLALQLRNMRVDLGVPGRFDPTYYANQLSSIVDRLQEPSAGSPSRS